jgi:hypothetical protein
MVIAREARGKHRIIRAISWREIVGCRVIKGEVEKGIFGSF